MNRFKVLPGKEEAFEQRWAERESKLEGMDGFLTFLLLRRDALKAEDGYNYSTLTVWRSKEDFQAWRESSANSAAHSKAGEAEPMFTGRPVPSCTRRPSAAVGEGGGACLPLLEFSAAVILVINCVKNDNWTLQTRPSRSQTAEASFLANPKNDFAR